MFNIGFAELIVILLVAFLIVGPSDLPKVARAVAKVYKKARRLWDEIFAALDLESELKDIKKATHEIETAVQEVNPLKQVQKEFDDVTTSIGAAKKEAEETLNK